MQPEYLVANRMMGYGKAGEIIARVRIVMYSRPIALSVALLAVSCALAATPRQDKTARSNQHQDAGNDKLKPITMPMAVYPDEPLKKNVEGTVTFKIVVDAHGNVSKVEVLSGPKELVAAAVATARMWRFEPPAHAPVAEVASISFGYAKPCPGPISDFGEVMGAGSLFDGNGKLAAVVEGEDYAMPRYPVSERKAGVAGEMVLSISLDTEGRLEGIHVVKSLSPALDGIAIHTVQGWRFKRVGDSSGPLKDLRLRFVFRPTCQPKFE